MGARRQIFGWGAAAIGLGAAAMAVGTGLFGPLAGGWIAVVVGSVVEISGLFFTCRALAMEVAAKLRAAEDDLGDSHSEWQPGHCAAALEQALEAIVRRLESARQQAEEIPRLRRHATRLEQELLRLGQLSDRLTNGALGQEETVNRTTASVEALADRIDRISANAEHAAAVGELTRQQASVGLEQIRELTAGMDRLREHVEANSRKLHRLGERLNEIGSIVDLISGLASRTDMLALNATIESVRAGEHGRGFAVVAEEIRKLAERATSGTREIGTLVEAIHDDARETFQALAGQQAEMERESERIREANEALERITQEAATSAQLIKEISSSAGDQVIATQELVAAIQQVSDSAQSILRETAQLREQLRPLQPALCEINGLQHPGGNGGPVLEKRTESSFWNGSTLPPVAG